MRDIPRSLFGLRALPGLSFPRWDILESVHHCAKDSEGHILRAIRPCQRQSGLGLSDIHVCQPLGLDRPHAAANEPEANRVVKVSPKPHSERDALEDCAEADLPAHLLKLFDLLAPEGEKILSATPFKDNL